MSSRLIILDFDGTLADSLPWFLDVLLDAAPRFGFRRPEPAEYESLRGQDNRAIMRALGVPMWKLPAIARHLRQRALGAPPPPLFPGIAEALTRLAEAGIVLGIASSNVEAQIRRALGPGLAGLIAHYACEASLFGKAARFRRILDESGIPAARALSIGDELRDIAAARDAGLSAGAVSWGYATLEALRSAAPDMIFSAPEDLLELLTPRPG